jgi:hypothetical protein
VPYVVRWDDHEFGVKSLAVGFMLRNWHINQGRLGAYVGRTPGPELPDHAFFSFALYDPPPAGTYDTMTRAELWVVGALRGIPISPGHRPLYRADIVMLLKLNDDRTVHPLID